MFTTFTQVNKHTHVLYVYQEKREPFPSFPITFIRTCTSFELFHKLKRRVVNDRHWLVFSFPNYTVAMMMMNWLIGGEIRGLWP